MKKIKTILGSIGIIVGFALFFAAQMDISTNTRYTFTRPFTQYEVQILSLKWLGILFMVFGVLDIILVVLAKRKEGEMQDPNNLTFSSGKCPNCGLLVSDGTRICPKCKTVLKGDSQNVKNNY